MSATQAPASVRYGVVTLTRAGHPRRYPVQADPGRPPRYLQGADWRLVPVAARARIEWSPPRD